MLFPINAPQPVAGRRGLLRAAVPLMGVPAGWQNGVTFDPESCTVVGPIDVNCWADDFTKTPPDLPGIVAFRPYAALGGDVCSTMAASGRDRRGRAERNLTATESWQVEREVFDGVISATRDDVDHVNPFLTDGNADAATSAPTPPKYALAAMERALADCLHGQRGMIHATPDVVSLWDADGLVRVEGELLLTVHDTIVVPGTGYSGDDPDGDTATAGSSWAYGTPVMYLLQASIETVGGDDQPGRVDRSVNTETYLVERVQVVLWNPCCLVAAEVDVTAPA